jgi:hypothetical protein
MAARDGRIRPARLNLEITSPALRESAHRPLRIPQEQPEPRAFSPWRHWYFPRMPLRLPPGVGFGLNCPYAHL